MRFFYKIFLSMLFVLTVSLATVEYLTVSYSLEHALQREENTAFSQHQMVKYSIQTVLLNITDSYTRADMVEIVRSAEVPLGTQSGLYFAAENKEKSGSDVLYYNSCKSDPSQKSVEDGKILYEIVTKAGNRYLQVRSTFSLKGSSYVLVTEKNVEELFQDTEKLYKRCEFFYWCILGAGSLLVLILTLAITRPLGKLRNTTRKFAAGEYGVRAKTGSRDEVGELVKTFNYMAKTIEKKIAELEDAARRQEDFTANFAHELKTPMTSIIGYADTLYQKTLPPEDVHQLAGIIMNEGMRLEAMGIDLSEAEYISPNMATDAPSAGTADMGWTADADTVPVIDENMEFLVSPDDQQLSLWFCYAHLDLCDLQIAVDALTGMPVFITYSTWGISPDETWCEAVADTYTKLYGESVQFRFPNVLEEMHIGQNLLSMSGESWYGFTCDTKDQLLHLELQCYYDERQVKMKDGYFEVYIWLY